MELHPIQIITPLYPSTKQRKRKRKLIFLNQRLIIILNFSSGASEGRGSFDNSDIQNGKGETDADLYIKDAILVFRALCKLSKKSIQSEW